MITDMQNRALPNAGGGGGGHFGYIHGQNPYGQGGANYRHSVPNQPEGGRYHGGKSREFGNSDLGLIDAEGNLSVGPNAQNTYEVAFLQLQLQECFERNRRNYESL